jgi:hypothetical protein
MQSKGLVLPRQPYKAVLGARKYSTTPSRLGEYLTSHCQRHSSSRRLMSSFKTFTSSPEQSDPSPEPSSSEPKEPEKEVIPLSSWAEDVSPPQGSTDDWGPPPANARHPGRHHPISNALFVLSLGGIAIGAFFLGRKYSE